MSKMQRLTINGNEYTVVDPNAARIDDALVGQTAWSGKNIVDRLCPTFTESGAVATCQPVVGYPLEAVSHIQPVQAGSGDPITGHTAVKLTRCGKNLSQYKSSDEANNSGHMNYYGLRCRSGITLTASADITREDTTLTENGTMRFYIYYTDGERTTGSASYGAEKDGQPHKKVITLTADATKTIDYLRLIPVAKDIAGDRADHIQIELGSTATTYELYRGDTFTIDFGQTVYGGSLDWTAGILTDENGNTHQLIPQEILALSGTNTLYSSTGDTAVTGRADPTVAMERLTNAVLALGGNI